MAAYQQLIQNQTDISLFLTNHVIRTKSKDKNLTFSPLSIHVVFNMLVAASKGFVHDQLLGFLKFKSNEEMNDLTSKLVGYLFVDGAPFGGPKFSFGNGIWFSNTLNFNPSFKHIADNVFKADCSPVDFQNQYENVRGEINTWVAEKTNGLIKDILSPGSVNSWTRIIFANAMYFKGTWLDRFESSMTRDEFFFLLNGNSLKVTFMAKYREKQHIADFADFQVLRLPYKRGNDTRLFSMLFFLPRAKDGLQALIQNICTQPRFIETHFPQQMVKVRNLLIPKFKVKFGFDATEVLESMGLQLPYLTEMVGGSESLPSKMIHEAFIEVNEEGTEAAAVTISMYVGCSMYPVEEYMVDFVADHPFFFVIREDTTGSVFFVGLVTNPLE